MSNPPRTSKPQTHVYTRRPAFPSEKGSGSSTGSGFTFSPSQTEGEQLYNFLKSNGYQNPSKFGKPEHLEYVFQNEKGLRLVKGIFKGLQKNNKLSPEEVACFDSMKTEGSVLYGRDLEDSMKRGVAISKQILNQKEKLASKEAELREKIKEKQNKILEIEKRKAVLSAMISRTEEFGETKGLPSKMRGESQELDLQLQVNWKRLDDRFAVLREILKSEEKYYRNIFTRSEEPSCREALDETLHLQDSVIIANLKRLFEKHVVALIVQSEGQGNEESRRNSINDFFEVLKDLIPQFDRLRFCIVYEVLRGEELAITLAGHRGVLKNMKVIKERINKNASKLVRGRGAGDCTADLDLVQDELETSYALDSAFEEQYKILLEKVQEEGFEQVDFVLKPVLDIKSAAKKHLWMTVFRINRILKFQKVRLDLLRRASNLHCHFYRDLVQQLHQFTSSYWQAKEKSGAASTGKSNQKRLSGDGRLLLKLFHQFDVPLPSLDSSYETSVALVELKRRIEAANQDELLSDYNAYNRCIQNLDLQSRTVHKLFDSFNSKYCLKNSDESRGLEELKRVQEEWKANLTQLQESKCRLVEESIWEKELLLSQIKDAFASAPNDHDLEKK